MKHYIIDAHNIIHFDKNLNKVLEQKSVDLARIELINLINPFAKKYPKYKITVVFDGVLGNVFSSLENLYVIEAGRYKKADDVIQDYIRWETNRKLCTVVSNDLEVVQYAKLHDCNILKTEDFLYELNFAKAGTIRKYDIENVKIIAPEMVNAKSVDNLLRYFEDNPIEGSNSNSNKKKKYSAVSKIDSKVNIKEVVEDIFDINGLKNYFEKGITSTKKNKDIKLKSVTIDSIEVNDKDVNEMMKLFSQK
ncbi:MAG: NYN domain-containing protein [Candidatus Kapabacteria bacterium]|nr:NYN domain-containing protein [Candidatus Kapabacteria bacterium]